MERFKVFIIAAMLGLSVGLLPKTSMAGDLQVGVGFFLGLPVPVVTFADDRPYYSHGRDYGPAYRPQGRYYRGYYHGEDRQRHYDHRDYRRGDNGHEGHGRGDFGRGHR